MLNFLTQKKKTKREEEEEEREERERRGGGLGSCLTEAKVQKSTESLNSKVCVNIY